MCTKKNHRIFAFFFLFAMLKVHTNPKKVANFLLVTENMLLENIILNVVSIVLCVQTSFSHLLFSFALIHFHIRIIGCLQLFM